jgi:transposase
MPAVETLRRVWLQQYYTTEAGPIRWRSVTDLPPAHVFINSPYDPEARYGGKRDLRWVGYKAHLTGATRGRSNRVVLRKEVPKLVSELVPTPGVRRA